MSYSDHFLSVRRCPASVVQCPSLTFRHLDHLLLNHLTNFNQTSQECSFGGPLSKLFKDLNSIKNFGCCSNRKGENCQILKNLLVQKYWPDLKNILHKCSLGYPLPRLFKYFRSIKKHGRQGAELFFVICALLKL